MKKNYLFQVLLLLASNLIAQSGSISGRIFQDFNANGIFDTADSIISNGWQINLQGPVNLTTVTDNTGHYSFNNLPAGTYQVSQNVPQNWTVLVPVWTGINSVTIVDGQILTNIDFADFNLQRYNSNMEYLQFPNRLNIGDNTQALSESAPISPTQIPPNSCHVSICSTGFTPNIIYANKNSIVQFALTSSDNYTHVFLFDSSKMIGAALGTASHETRMKTWKLYNVEFDEVLRFHCDIPGHEGRGEYGYLIVTSSLLSKAATPTGATILCQNPANTVYSTTSLKNALSYIWEITPSSAGTIVGTDTFATVQWNKAFIGVAQIAVKGHSVQGNGQPSNFLSVIINSNEVNAGQDQTIICGGAVQLNNVTTNYTGTGTLKYKWTPSTGLNNDSIPNPTATVTSDITYTVTVTTPNGCTATDEVSVIIIPMVKPEIGMVGVSSNNKNLIAWNKPVSAGIESYYIYRESNVTNVYDKIGTVHYDSLSIFVDNQSLPDVQSNKYKLSIYDRHGLESPQSNYHKTMHLAINKGMGNVWNLSWEAYEGFVVSTYNIYRGTTPINLTLLGSTSGSNTQYNDLNAPSGDVYYQLEVISPNSVNPTKVLSSQKTKAEENDLSNSLISYSSSRSNIATNVVSGINELGKNKISIYPNPVKNELRIDFEGGSTFEILNLMGQAIYKDNLIKNTIVQTSNLSSGIYLIKFKMGNSFVYRKIIKE
jgi:hypothetical protein